MSVADVVILRATPDDAEALSEYVNALADENLKQLSGLRPSPQEERDFLHKASENKRALVLIALDDARIVGVLDLWPGDRVYNRHAGRLGMTVLTPYRRNGIGRKLLEIAIDEAKKHDLNRIELEVVTWNQPAIRLYESHGFVREGTKQRGAIFKGEPMDLLLMALVW